ncbi:sulfotransferase [Spirulina sp. 06S082]|uniref:sulfotransferase family protein n=1 Tax=Spirulina sp. 06S082 TaxID=3110248 RepID=UPI002B1FB0AA|nr:sulfotransferase [Spirulina sp. 06S082]MEA5469872.1 sulfotransferase [Spirulina sp. 06S082]
MAANFFNVVTTQEIVSLSTDILAEAKSTEMPQTELAILAESLDLFKCNWERTFARFGHSYRGELSYRDLIIGFQEQIAVKVKKWLPESSNGTKAVDAIASILSVPKTPHSRSINLRLLARLKLGVKPELHWDARYRVADTSQGEQLPNIPRVLDFFKTPTTPEKVWHLLSLESENLEEFTQTLQKSLALKQIEEDFPLPEFDRPIFIVSAPRAGSTLLFETLSQFAEIWSVGTESHDIIEAIPELHPAYRDYCSNRLTEKENDPHITLALKEGFARQLRDRTKTAYLNLPIQQRPNKLRFLEKTPRNALRVSFLKAVFPDALFIFLYREPRANISSMIEGWRSRRFIAYPSLPGWPYRDWSFLLVPGWEHLKESSLAEIAAYQWKTTNACIIEDLKTLPRSDWCGIRYNDLVNHPKETITKIKEFAGLSWNEKIEAIVSQSLPISRMSFSQPSPDKWRKNEQEIAEIMPLVEPLINLVESENLC